MKLDLGEFLRGSGTLREGQIYRAVEGDMARF